MRCRNHSGKISYFFKLILLKMKNVLAVCFLLCITKSLAQDYSQYYSLCNEADSLVFIDKKEDALRSYKKAFSTVDFIHSSNLKKAYELSIQLNLFEDAYSYGKMVVINSGKIDFLKTKSSIFKKSEFYKELMDSSSHFLSIYNNRINNDYIKIIDSLVYVDQYIIRNNRSYKGDYDMGNLTIPTNVFDLDSSNWILLYECIQKFGFPSEKNVGLETYEKAWVLLHHNLRLKQNELYHQEIFDFIKSGDYLPEDIMVWYEQFHMQIYGQTYFTTWDGNLSEENLLRLNTNRRAFYLKGIHSYELEKNGRYMHKKW